MRLSSTLILSLLAFDNVSSAFKQTSIERRMRMLQMKEVGGTSSPRKLAKGSEKKAGNKSSRSGDKGEDKKGRKADDFKKGINGRYEGKDSKESHTAHLDANDSGITTDATEYTYGDPIQVAFELTDYKLTEDDVMMMGDATGTDERRLNELDLSTLKVGLFMRMANPQGGALEPIMQVTPTIADHSESDTSTATDSGNRMLKGTRNMKDKKKKHEEKKKKRGEKKKSDPKKKGDPPTTPVDPEEPPTTTINLSGTATFTTTDADSLNPSKYGLGFDVYLLDENGAAMVGPATFYLKKSGEMILSAASVAIQMAEEAPIIKYNPTKIQHVGGKKEDPAMMAQAMGIGSGKDGESMIIAATERLAEYRLETDATYYVIGDEITATFDIHQDEVSEGGRLLQKTRPWGKKGKKKNKGKNKGKKGKKPNKPKKPRPPTTTTTIATTSATTTSTQAPPTTQAPPDTTTESPPQTTTQAPPDTTTDAPEDETTTSTSSTTTQTTTTVDFDGSTQAPPEAPDVTSTEAPPEVDMSAENGEDDSSPEDDEMEEEDEIDPDDVRLFSIGIFMRMANPQEGKLSPIHSIPFCPNGPEDCYKKAGELQSDTFKFSSLDLNTEENGSGYDVWVLNGLGQGVAGPHTFYVENEVEIGYLGQASMMALPSGLLRN